MRLEVHASIDAIPAADWNRLAGEQPFVRHEFLAALEHSGCVSVQTGWQPLHLACYDDAGGLAGALPLYLKSHSFGEYVFDWAWAEAWQRAGQRYYPKLVSAVPFSPVPGARLLATPGPERPAVLQALLQGLRELAIERRASSAHCLFPEEPELATWTAQGFLLRQDCQFRWHNRGYRDFEAYLAALTAERRKKIRRERRRVHEAGICLHTARGDELDEPLLDALFGCYAATYAKRGRHPYLNRAFFAEIARTLPQALVVVFVRYRVAPVAAAIFFRDAHALYGRHWGCLREFHSLHFEACYYQGIEYCLREGLRRFHPGAQGEYKLLRGFEPVPVWSCHWLADAALRATVADFLRRETVMMEDYRREAGRHLPFRAPAG